MTSIKVSAVAEADLQAIISYTKLEWGRTQAETLKNQLQSSIVFLSEFPECGRSIKQLGAFARPVPKLPFVILYSYSKNEIIILQILHSKRNR